MKLSNKEGKLLKHEIHQGFMRAWLAESCATKERRRVAVQKAKWNALSWFAFWHPIEPVRPAAAKAAGARE